MLVCLCLCLCVGFSLVCFGLLCFALDWFGLFVCFCFVVCLFCLLVRWFVLLCSGYPFQEKGHAPDTPPYYLDTYLHVMQSSGVRL